MTYFIQFYIGRVIKFSNVTTMTRGCFVNIRFDNHDRDGRYNRANVSELKAYILGHI